MLFRNVFSHRGGGESELFAIMVMELTDVEEADIGLVIKIETNYKSNNNIIKNSCVALYVSHKTTVA